MINITLLDHMGCSLDIVNAAKVSFLAMSTEYGDKEKKILRYLILNSHTSPLEMSEFKFKVDCPIPIARQWMRHRAWSYNEVSRRYTDQDISFYTPKEDIRVAQLYNDAKSLYYKLIEEGWTKEDARGVLPLNLMTSFLAKTDGNNLIKFVILRSHKSAQKEIRELANKIIELTTPYIGDVWDILKIMEVIC